MRGLVAVLAIMGWPNLAGVAVVFAMQAGFVAHVAVGLRRGNRSSSSDA